MIDVIDLSALSPTEQLATLCTLDGVPVDNVTGIIDVGTFEPGVVPARAAWRFDLATESIIPVGKATVTCQIEGT